MATVTPARSGRSLVEDNRRVRSPLDRLRGYIRSYVSLEGVAVVGLYLALWFWIGLLLDYGVFKATGMDWVQVLPWGMRLGLLVVLASGVLAAFAVKVLTRLFRTFSDAALALVLERRFPRELGDRLITAVELSDPDKAAAYGYSKAMVKQTIHEAADRVGQLPVGQVFDWKRLVRRGAVIGVLVVVGYFLAVAGYGAFAYFTDKSGKTGPGAGFHRFNDVAAIWFERNILLDNTIWPRDAHLVVLQPSEDDLRVGYNAPAPNIRVRALGFVVADRKAPEGWRALTWEDLFLRPALAGGEKPPEVPDDWKPREELFRLPASAVDAAKKNVRRESDAWDYRSMGEAEKKNAARILAVTAEVLAKLDTLKNREIQREQVLTLLAKIPDGVLRSAAQDKVLDKLEEIGLTVDEVELHLGRFDVRKTPPDANNSAPAKWVIASATAESGQRPLLWSDLSTRKLGGLPVPQLGSTWDPRSWPVTGGLGLASGGSLLAASYLALGPVGLTVDEVEAQLQKIKTAAADAAAAKDPGKALAEHGAQPKELDKAMASVEAVLARLEQIAEVQTALDRVRTAAADPGMSRTLRKLAIPDKVNLVYRGKTTTSNKSLIRSPDDEVAGYEFTGTFTDLKAETYGYHVWAKDYSSATRAINVLPPPALVSLVAEQRRPAYLYYRPAPDDNGAELRGLKQPFEEIDMSSLGGDVSRVEVPAGTDVTLIARVNKDLSSVDVRPFKDGDKLDIKPPDGAAEAGKPVEGGKPARKKLVSWQGDSFKAHFPNVRREQNCVFVFTDADNVVGTRQVVIKPKDDQPPDMIDVMPDAVVRKTKDGYIVSTEARVPFAGRVIDDNGLSGVRYAYTLAKIDSGVKLNFDAFRMFAVTPFVAGGRGNGVLAVALFASSQLDALRPTGDQETAAPLKTVRLPNLPSFEQALRERAALDRKDAKDELKPELLPLQTVKELLDRKQKLPYRSLLRDLPLKPDDWTQAEADPLRCDFAVWPLKLKALGDREIQARYKMTLWLEAVDTDVDSEVEADGKTPRPHLSPSKDKFTFLIVGETELLTEIAKEEEELRVKLEEVYNYLLESEAKMIRETVDLASAAIKAENLGAMSNRLEGVDQLLDKQQQKTKEVYTDYARILEELRINRVDQKIQGRVNKTIVSPLKEIADFDFDTARKGLENFRKALEEGRSTNNAATFPETLATARAAGSQARDQVRALKEALRKVLENMQTLTGINELIKMLRKIEEQESAQYDLIKRIKDRIEDEIIKGATGDLPKKP